VETSTFTSIEGSVVQLATPSGGFHGEAELVAQEIISRADLNWGSCAALYRTKAQSALLERELIKHQVPYSVRGGASFFARKEIYQMVFFLSAAYCNSIQAIVGYPRNEARGIPGFSGIGNLPTLSFGKTTRYLGNASFNKLDMIFKSTNNPDMVQVVREFERSLDTRSRPGARDLGDMLQNLRAEASNPREALEWVFRNVYEPQIKLDTDDDEDAYNNKVTSITVLQDIAAEYQDITAFVDYCLGRMFEGFGQNDAPRNAVQLMTIHASKGLEFKNVFVLGVNDRYLPHARGEMNEELRLFYVAATRAEEYLLLVSPVGIDFYGKELNPSSFLSIAMGETEF
jgi:DNA helicase-2/ATP-dependent DNA helicase PcrA